METTRPRGTDSVNTISGAVKALTAMGKAIKALTSVGKAAASVINDFVCAMIYSTNDRPKWWHLYKHAKKRRTRKKYRRLLMHQLNRKLAAAVT